jgi:hypothetical protein
LRNFFANRPNKGSGKTDFNVTENACLGLAIIIIWLEYRKVKAAISLMMTDAFCSIRISYFFYASAPLLKIVSPMREEGGGGGRGFKV